MRDYNSSTVAFFELIIERGLEVGLPLHKDRRLLLAFESIPGIAHSLPEKNEKNGTANVPKKIYPKCVANSETISKSR